MAASLRLTGSLVPDGPARFDPRRDLRAVVDLLRLGFGRDLAPQDLRWLDGLSRISGASLTLQSMANGLPGAGEATGQVYYHDGQLVGNVSAFRCGRDVWVVANVVTHPAWRGQGIASRLMRLAIQDLGRRGAHQLQLQVRADNLAAQKVYASLGFWRMNSAVALRLPAYSLGRRGPTSQLVQALDMGVMEGLDDWMSGRRRRTMVVDSSTGPLAIGTLLNQGRIGPHRLEMAADPDWTGRVEGALLDGLLSLVATVPAQDIEAEVDARAGGPLASLLWAGFRRSRTLDRLALDL